MTTNPSSYKRIAVTGTPATGKTMLAKTLAKKLSLPWINVNALVKTKKLAVRDDEDRKTTIVNTEKLRRELEKHAAFVVDSHLLCEFPLKNTIVLVLRCDPRVLQKRLKKRGYSPAKIRENLEAEALDYCTLVSEKHYKRVYDINTTNKTPAQVVNATLRVLKKRQGDLVDFSNWLLDS